MVLELAGIEKAAATSIGKVLVMPVSAAKKQIKRRLTNDALRREFNRDQKALIAGMEIAEETAIAVSAVLQSPDLEAYATSIAAAVFLDEGPRDRQRRIDDIRGQFCRATKLRGAARDNNEVASAVFNVLVDHVVRLTASVANSSDQASVYAQACAIRAQVHYAAAVTRLEQFAIDAERYREFDAFVARARKQIAGVHSTMRLPHAGTTRQIPYEALFVGREIQLAHRHPQSDEDNDSVDLDILRCEVSRSVLLGDPGGGKSTLSLKLTYDIAAAVEPAQQRIPFLVPLRDFADRTKAEPMSVVTFIEERLAGTYQLQAPQGAVEYAMLTGRAHVVFDGLDEILEVARRSDVVTAIEAFSEIYPSTPVTVTSRKVGYSDAALDPDDFLELSLLEFDEDRVEDYTRKWFKLDESHPVGARGRLATGFLKDSHYVHDIRKNPLMLSLMCGIYASEEYIPRNRPEVYEKCAMLLFDKWDRQRGINSPLSFSAHVHSALGAIAYEMLERGRDQDGMAERHLIDFMTAYLTEKRFDDPDEARQAAADFIGFCKGRAWVLSDLGGGHLGFTHRTFLEYFAASFLTRRNISPESLRVRILPFVLASELDSICQLAVQMLGKNVDDGADDLLRLMLLNDGVGDLTQRRNVLGFCARALAFIVPRPDVLKLLVREVVSSDIHFEILAGKSPGGVPFVRMHLLRELLRSANAENGPRILRAVRDELFARDGDEAGICAEFLLSLHVFAVSTLTSDIMLGFDPGFREQGRARIRSLRGTSAWADAQLVLTGEMRPGEFVDLHGLPDLLVCSRPGGLGFSLLESLYYGLRRTSEVPWRSGIEELRGILLSCRPPIVLPTEELRYPHRWSLLRSVRTANDRARGSVVMDLLVLMTQIWVDLVRRAPQVFDPEGGENSILEVLGQRSATWRRELRDNRISDEVAQVTDRWVRGEFRWVGRDAAAR